eukprot:1161481_1
MSFVWNLPLMPAENRKSLCHGYIRNNYNNHIATHIMGLCSTFYSPSFFTLKDIKNATSFPKYVSPIFTVDEFKCCVQIWPSSVSPLPTTITDTQRTQSTNRWL